MSGKNLMNYFSLLKLLLFLTPSISMGQGKGLLFDDAAFKHNVRKQYLGPAFQDELLPQKVSLKEFCPTPGNQGNMGSCVGWSVGYGAYTISNSIRKSIKDKEEITSSAFSALYLYNQIKISDCSNGAYIDKALTFSKQKGDCVFSLFNPKDCYAQPSNTLETTKIADFQALFYGNESKQTRLYAVKQKIKDRFPVIIGFETNNMFSTKYITKENPVWQSGGKNDGGHAVVIVGYDDEKGMFEILNSWGTSFGDGGYFWMKYDDFIVYTHYAAILILPEIHESDMVTLEGSVNLRYFDKTLNRLEDVNMIKGESYKYITAKQDWNLGEIFQLNIKNRIKNEYVYVFSIDGLNNTNIHFPRRKEFGNLNSIDINESPLFTSAKGELFIPNNRTGMQLNTNKEVLCILFSKEEIADLSQTISQIRDYYKENANLSTALEKTLGSRLISTKNISYSSTVMNFNVKAKYNSIAPIIIELNTKK